MSTPNYRLRELPISLRLACTFLVLILGGGFLTGARHIYDHYQMKDERAGLSMDDIIGSFHGINSQAALLRALPGHMKDYLSETEQKSLLAWLQGERISEEYDDIDLGENAPAEVIDRRCLKCHARNATEGDGIGARMPLEYWDDVKPLAYSKQLDPVPISILTVSTHTHAPGMALIALAGSLLLLGTRWARRFRHGVILLAFTALFADLASWWLARLDPLFCYVILAAGGLFGVLVGLQILAVLADLWLPAPPSRS